MFTASAIRWRIAGKWERTITTLAARSRWSVTWGQDMGEPDFSQEARAWMGYQPTESTLSEKLESLFFSLGYLRAIS
jgi:hypothetical protein